MKIVKIFVGLILLSGTGLSSFAYENPIHYEYVEKEFDYLPDFDYEEIKDYGYISDFDLGVAHREDNFAIRFVTCLVVEEGEYYYFKLHSDDGSRLIIDGQIIIDNDGTHGPATEYGDAYLEPGERIIEVEYFEAYDEQVCEIEVSNYHGDYYPLEWAYLKPVPYKPHYEPDHEKICKGDLSIGPNRRKMVGNRIINATGRRQKSTNHLYWGKNKFVAMLQNRGNETESFRLRGTKKKRQYSVRYRAGSKNITASVIRGTYEVANLPVGRKKTIRIEVKPTHYYRYGRSINLALTARSWYGECVDKVKACLIKKH